MRQALALILFAQAFALSELEVGQEGDERQEQDQAGVFSRRHLVTALSWQSGPRVMLDFVEDLIAVRFAKFLLFITVLGFFIVVTYFNTYMVRELLNRFGAPRNVGMALGWIVYFGTLITGIWLSLAVVGVELLGILLTFGIIGIFIGPAVGTWVVNVVSAIWIQISDKVELDQLISVGGDLGYVVDMTLSDVIIRRYDDTTKIVYIPNSHFFQTSMTRYTQPPPGAATSTASAASARLQHFVVSENEKTK